MDAGLALVDGLQAAVEAAALQQKLKDIFEDMPRDLQQTMLSSPHRAALLQGSGPQIKASPSDSHAWITALLICGPLGSAQVDDATTQLAFVKQWGLLLGMWN